MTVRAHERGQGPPPDPEALARRYCEVRTTSVRLCDPLSAEDCSAQSMEDASPTKWHLAHTTWFFETFLLERILPRFEPFAEPFRVLFNSYYNSVGEQHPRPERGILTRPALEEVLEYRRHVDRHLLGWLESGPSPEDGRLPLVDLGLHHEQQHQELMLTDLKHLLGRNPLRPAYAPKLEAPAGEAGPLRWCGHEAGLRWVGHEGDGFAFDNEGPRHRRYLEAFELASRPVTCGEFDAFVADGGYQRPELWLSDGWATARERGWNAPLYWEPEGRAFTLAGLRRRDPAEPVTHVSFYEADAYARWAEARLPTEAEWECAAEPEPLEGRFLESGCLHPAPAGAPGSGPRQLYGDVWEWTASPYLPYPGYQPPAGALGEYNGKFMSNQMVLRGGSCATPLSHLRPTYRNFFPPDARWQFSGFRLARDA